jgi:aminoglycoside phosphotransferase (APT) family kinase protein
VSEWSPEVVVGADRARRLIGAQFPQVDTGSLRLLGEGWDNTVWLAGGRWAFRFPRRTAALPGFERELAVLPRLAPLLPLAVPRPVFRGRAGHGFPWPFSGAELIPGGEAEQAVLTDAQRARAARPLARFLRALHSADPEDLPADPMGRADMALRSPWAIARLAAESEAAIWDPPPRLLELIEDARTLPPPPATVTCHGDLHGRHLLVDGQGLPTGVIDWGDVCRADPSVDLPLYWSFLPPAARPAFVDEYGPVGADGLLRARVLAVFLSATLAVYGRSVGMADLERGAVAALRRAAEG